MKIADFVRLRIKWRLGNECSLFSPSERWPVLAHLPKNPCPDPISKAQNRILVHLQCPILYSLYTFILLEINRVSQVIQRTTWVDFNWVETPQGRCWDFLKIVSNILSKIGNLKYLFPSSCEHFNRWAYRHLSFRSSFHPHLSIPLAFSFHSSPWFYTTLTIELQFWKT